MISSVVRPVVADRRSRVERVGRLGVEVFTGFVEHEDREVSQQRAGESQALTLAA